MGRCPKPRQRSFAPLESQLWLAGGLICSPPLGDFAFAILLWQEVGRWGLICSPPLGGFAFAILLWHEVGRWGAAPNPAKGASPLWNPSIGYSTWLARHPVL